MLQTAGTPLLHEGRAVIEVSRELLEEGRVVGIVAVNIGGLERRDIDGIADGKVHGRVYHVAQGGLVVLYGAPFAVVVVEKDELLLLAGPEGADALTVELQGGGGGGGGGG